MTKRIKEFISFVSISGIGFLLDFTLYTVLTSILHLEVGVSNILSGIPAVTLVFIVSTSKIFQNKEGKLSLKWKYCMYSMYQLLLLSGVSLLGQQLYLVLYPLMPISLLQFLPTLVKVSITPITMITNFFVMKWMTERL